MAVSKRKRVCFWRLKKSVVTGRKKIGVRRKASLRQVKETDLEKRARFWFIRSRYRVFTGMSRVNFLSF
jgi:hypothetical protein